MEDHLRGPWRRVEHVASWPYLPSTRELTWAPGASSRLSSAPTAHGPEGWPDSRELAPTRGIGHLGCTPEAALRKGGSVTNATGQGKCLIHAWPHS